LFSATGAAETLDLRSPDSRIAVEVSDSGGGPAYSVRFRGREVVSPSSLGLQFERYQTLSSGMKIGSSARRSGDDRYTLPAAKASTVRDPYNELVVRLAETSGAKRRLEIVFRAYDDGVAFRYRVPQQPGLSELRLANEATQFRLPADYDCHGLNLGRQDTSHEGEFDPVKVSAIRQHHLYELPLVCGTGHGDAVIAFAEADLEDYAGLFLSGLGGGGLGLEARLAQRPDDPAIAVLRRVGPGGMETPWRVIMLADHVGRLIESTLITSLNPAPRGDFSWVKPGKYAWDWWNGPVLASVPKAGTNNATIRGFIDFAAENGLPYMMVDEGWYANSGAGGTLLPGADNLKPAPDVDIPALVRYGAERKVGLWLWVHWKLLERNMDEALRLYASWGVKGVKVDFMDRTDQEMVNFYHRLLRTAAANKLMVNLHGAYRPTGLIRTYPHFLTQEGVLGAEYNKWSRRITARHNVTLPFTRMLVGPMDYTPGGFRNVSPAAFQPRNLAPMVMTTRAHGLAMYVVYDSPFQGVSDTPDAYRRQPGLDFIRAVPAAWDETRFISGAVGEHVAVARRKGRDWYVGAMTNEQGRHVELPLGFLGAGRYRATIWRDGGEPSALATETREVTAADTVPLTMAPSGGAAIRLSPLR
jgi:alpha-glucosidase